MFLRSTCITLLLLLGLGGGAAAAAPPAPAPSPPKAAAAASAPAAPADEEPEPPPAPLQIEEPEKSQKTEPPATRDEAAKEAARTERANERSARRVGAVGWTSLAVTVALVVTGTTVGVLAQRRSDDLGYSTTQLVDGLPPIYDDAQRDAFTTLQREGQAYNRAAITCFIFAGVGAVATGVIFWEAARLRPKNLAALRLSPELSPRGGALSLVGRF